MSYLLQHRVHSEELDQRVQQAVTDLQSAYNRRDHLHWNAPEYRQLQAEVKVAEEHLASLRNHSLRIDSDSMRGLLQLLTTCEMVEPTKEPLYDIYLLDELDPLDPKTEAERLQILGQHPDHPRGIASHKLNNRSGWLVTPEEIEAAITALRSHRNLSPTLPKHLAHLWAGFLNFLELARMREGFFVR